MGKESDTLEKGLQAFKLQDYTTAVAELEQATMEDHEDFKAFLYLGAAYAGVGRYNAAIGALKRAAELRPDDARVHYNLGQAYEAAGVPREAIYEYAQALRINPYYTHARTAYSSLKTRTSAHNSRGMRLSA
ncbi:MAG TPA: tetratricopeptide repeat protein [Armatimonadota bacterium]|nr:tetratricopeptide repeat protein [Armatimonadota bacterium]